MCSLWKILSKKGLLPNKLLQPTLINMSSLCLVHVQGSVLSVRYTASFMSVKGG